MKLKKILAAVFALAMVTVIAAVSVSAHGRNPIAEVTKTQVAAEAQVGVKVGDKAPAPKKDVPKPGPKHDEGPHHDNGGHHEDHHGDRR